jgi:phosphate uptake regulator
MSLFNDIIKIWKSDSLLSQAWDDSISMLKFSNDIFIKSVDSFNSHDSVDEVKALKKEDRKINDYQMTVRRKVLTHFSLETNSREVPNGLILVDMVVDIERIGDYCKNISDLTLMKEAPIDYGELADEITAMEQEVKSRFTSTIQVIENQDEDLARSLIDNYKEMVSSVSDKIVSGIVSGDVKLDSHSKSASLVLYARYLKRIGAHLKNITSTVVNAYDRIGYER